MKKFFVNLLLNSTGMKRNVASLLAVLLLAAQEVPALGPDLGPYMGLITWLAGIFGATGVGMAAAQGNLTMK
mgnify:CR=1 FL=1